MTDDYWLNCCGLADVRINASDKDLPVSVQGSEKKNFKLAKNRFWPDIDLSNEVIQIFVFQHKN